MFGNIEKSELNNVEKFGKDGTRQNLKIRWTKVENLGYDINIYQKHEAFLNLWNFETLKGRTMETLELWNFETSKLWNLDTLKLGYFILIQGNPPTPSTFRLPALTAHHLLSAGGCHSCASFVHRYDAANGRCAVLGEATRAERLTESARGHRLLW